MAWQLEGSHIQIDWTEILATRGKSSSLDETSLLHLRSFFGEDVTILHEHLLATLLNVAPWTYEWTAWLSDSLTRLSTCRGFDHLRLRLIDTSRFMEAWTVLQVAERAHAVGLDIAFDVPISSNGESKIPDLQIYDSSVGASFFCEISVLYIGRTQGDIYELHNQLFHLLVPIGEEPLAFSCCLFPGAIDQDKKAILKRVAWEIMEVRHDRTFREVHIPQALLLGMAPHTESDSVKQWGLAHGLNLNSTVAIPPAIDHLRRLGVKLAEKAKQLSPDTPNLLVLWAQDLFINTQDPAALAPLVTEAVLLQPRISVLVLICEGRSIEFVPVQTLANVCLSVSHRGGISYQILIVSNDAASNNFPHTTFEKVVKAFSL